jgi:hypothetical protein
VWGNDGGGSFRVSQGPVLDTVMRLDIQVRRINGQIIEFHI